MDSKFINRFYNQDCSDVIDLTGSCEIAIPSYLCDTVIELDTTNDSFNTTFNSNSVINETLVEISSKKRTKSTSIKKKTKKSPRKSKTLPRSSEGKENRTPGTLGECPICCENLGKNPLASTKCGHVYCVKCLETSLKIAKKCPTCRCVLKGSSAYHPLYLN